MSMNINLLNRKILFESVYSANKPVNFSVSYKLMKLLFENSLKNKKKLFSPKLAL